MTTTQDTRETTLESTHTYTTSSLPDDALVAYLESIRNYDSLPDNDVTKAYIMSFPSNFQRQVIASQLSYCPFVPLCSHSLNVTDQSTIASCCQTCSCLPNCTEYSTCCPDIATIAIVKDDSAADNVTKTCIPLHINMYLTPPIFTDAAFGIANCPAASTYADSWKCKQIYDQSDITMIDIYPVRHVQTGLIFRNMHCALCNGIQTVEFEFLEAEFECTKRIHTNDIKTDYEFIRLILDKRCDIRFFTDIGLENCVGSISRCDHNINWTQHGRFYENACTMYTSFVYKDDVVFQNVFCALCNGYTDITYACNGDSNEAYPFSFSGLLSFSGPNNEDKSLSSRHCGAGFIYHRDADECIEAHCSPVRRLVGNECKTVLDNVKLSDYEVMLRLTPSVPFNTDEIMDKIAFVFNEVTNSPDIPFAQDSTKLSICGFNFMLKTDTLCSDIHVDSQDNQLDYLLLRLFLRLNFDHNPDEILSKLHSQIDLDISGAWVFENVSLNVQVISGFEEDFEKGFPTSAPPKRFCSSIDDKVLIPFKSSIYSENCQYFEAQGSLSSYLTCPTIKISNTFSPWIINDDGVLFVKSGHVFDHSQFYITYVNESVLFLCKDRYFELLARSFITEWTISPEHIVSIIFVSLSILCLIVSLVVFCLLTPLRTLPGKNNMALVSALLTAQAFYLVSSFSRLEQGSVFCKAVGILTHFSWLLVVFWMNVCTYHMFHVLTKTKAISRRSGNKRYLAYHFYCIVCSSVFVGINIIVSHVTSDYSDIGYGTSRCYISSHYMLMYTFAIPLAVSIVSNIVMFLIVIVYIKKASAIQKNVQNERNDIAVFARLSTLTGATWTFGFIYTWTNVAVLSYVFIILNAGQGVFLFLSFICTRRVIRMASQKYSTSFSATGSNFQLTSMSSRTTIDTFDITKSRTRL